MTIFITRKHQIDWDKSQSNFKGQKWSMEMGVPHPTPFLFFFHTDVLHRAHRDRMASRFSQHNGQSSTFATPHAHTPMLALQARRLVLRRLLSFPISFPVADFIVGQWRPEHWKQVYYTYPADQDGVSKCKVSKATVKISKGHENSRRASTCVLARKHNHILAVFNSPPPLLPAESNSKFLQSWTHLQVLPQWFLLWSTMDQIAKTFLNS